MAESRRVQLTTLSCALASLTLPCSDPPAKALNTSPSAAPAGPGIFPPFGPDRPQDPGAVRPDRPQDADTFRPPDRQQNTETVRLELTLFEPDDHSFPEFSYSQLVENKIKNTDVKVPLSRFEEEEKRANDEAEAIARKLEEKYGGKQEKKKDRIQDLIDIGYGYDDEDSFIDNSEAYDEFVPACITTKYGGFYVNTGVLKFRQASDTEDLSAEDQTLEASKKRKLNGDQDLPKKKPCREDRTGNELDFKSSTLSANELEDGMMKRKKKKKKKKFGTLSVTSMLKKFQREKLKERQKTNEADERPMGTVAFPAIPLCLPDTAGGGGPGLGSTDPLLSLIGSTNDHALIQAANTVDFEIDLHSLLDVSEETPPPKLAPLAATETLLFQPKTEEQTQSDATNDRAQPPATKTHPSQNISSSPLQIVPLPEKLPPGLEDSIRKLMAVAKTSEGESKLKFFSQEINSILLDIELQCREHGGPLRSKVYTHLSAFLPCSRDTLLKRVKKLLLTHMEESPDLEYPMRKLKEAIGKAMPEQIACFNEICQVKISKATEEEREVKQKTAVGPEDTGEEKGGKRGPRKLFKWNEEIRECLCHLLKVKMESYKKERKGSEEMEEYLKTLLNNEVKPLWPKGWMQSRMLIRESRKMLHPSSVLPVKRARTEKKLQPSFVSPPVVVEDPPPLEGASQEDDVFIVDSSPSGSASQVGDKTGRSASADPVGIATPTESDRPPPVVRATPAQTNSLLNLLADQALAREQPLSVSQELLAAAVAKYKRSVQQWSLGVDRSPLLLPTPPAPHSTPVNYPMSKGPPGGLLQMGDFARHVDAGQVQIISSDSDTTIQ